MNFINVFVLYFVSLVKCENLHRIIKNIQPSSLKQDKVGHEGIKEYLNRKEKDIFNPKEPILSGISEESSKNNDFGVWHIFSKSDKGEQNDEKKDPSGDNKDNNGDSGGDKPPDGGDGGNNRKFNFDRLCKQDKVLLTLPELKLIHSCFLFLILLLTIWYFYAFHSFRHLLCILSNYKRYDGYNDYCEFDRSDYSSIGQEGYSFTLPGLIIVRCLVVYTLFCQAVVVCFVCNELCIPIVSSVEHWDARARPFLLCWLVGFFTLLVTFLVKNTRVGKNLFIMRVPLDSCTLVKISDYNKSSTEHDILNSTLDLIRGFITKLKLCFNIPDSIFRIPFEKYRAVKHCYVPVFTSQSERCFYYHYVKHTFSPELSYFVDASHKLNSYLINTNLIQLLDDGGLTESESARRTEDIGPNEIEVERLDFWTLLYREVSDPVFFMQLYLTIKSIYWRSYITAPIWASTTFYTVYKKVRIIHEQQRDIYDLTKSSDEKLVTVMRENEAKRVMTRDLAVGDIVRVENNWEVPSDMIMLRGDAVVDESSITGESIPLKKRKLDLSKFSSYNLNIYDFIHTPKNKFDPPHRCPENKFDPSHRCPDAESIGENLLKSGTRVISVLGNEETSCSAVAVVIATGVFTTKGKQMKGVLFPNQFRLKYDTQLPLVFILTFLYALFCSYYQIQFLGWNMTSIFYSIGTMSQVVPVWTSTIISISQSRACERLSKSESIYCIAPSRIAVCGKLRVLCFDKTGTLTNNRLVFNGCKFTHNNAISLLTRDMVVKVLDGMKELKGVEGLIALAIATCHSVWPCDSPEQYGNHVDKSMFACTNCEVDQYIDEDGRNKRFIKSPSNPSLNVEILNTFDFDYQKKLSSVIVSTGAERIVFVKGAFENLSLCCNNEFEPLTVLSNNESSNGSYVLGLAYKYFDGADFGDRNLVESNLTMLGLLIFNNEVRVESKEVIQTLGEAMVRSVILTGDNIPASQYVAKVCNIIADTEDKKYPIAIMNRDRIEWKYPFKQEDEEKLFFSDEFNDISMTGDVFDYIENNWNEILAKFNRLSTNESNNQTKFEHFLMKIRIFARLNPNQKVRVINSFKRLGIITGMCGDGTNDCLALQASHAGISLTNGVTSMVSPFSSMNNKLESVIYLIREGRGSLVTCLACFKFMLLFGLMIAFVKVTLFKNCRAVMPEWGYLLIENAILLLLSYTMALSRPSEKLRIRSPTSSLLGPLTLFSVGIMFTINISFLFTLFYLYHKLGKDNTLITDLEIPNSLKYNSSKPPAAWWILSDNFEAPTVCLWLCYQVVNTALVFSFGGVFRESVLRNQSFTLSWVLINTFLTYLLFSKPNRLTCLFRINCTDEVSKMTKIPFLHLFSTSASGLPFHGQVTHNVLPLNFKISFLLLNIVNAVLNCIIAKLFFSNSFIKRLRESIGYKCSADRIKI